MTDNKTLEALELLQESTPFKLRIALDGKEHVATIYPIDAGGIADILTTILRGDSDTSGEGLHKKVTAMLLAKPETVARCIQLEPEYKKSFVSWLKREGSNYLYLATKVLEVTGWEKIYSRFFALVGLMGTSPVEK